MLWTCLILNHNHSSVRFSLGNFFISFNIKSSFKFISLLELVMSKFSDAESMASFKSISVLTCDEVFVMDDDDDLLNIDVLKQ